MLQLSSWYSAFYDQMVMGKPLTLWLRLSSELVLAIAYYGMLISLAAHARKKPPATPPWIFFISGMILFVWGTSHALQIPQIWKEPDFQNAPWTAATYLVAILVASWLWRTLISLPAAEEPKPESPGQEIVPQSTVRIPASKTEQEAQELSRNYKVLLDCIDGVFWEADPNTFQFSFVSKQAEHLLGYPVGEWLSEPAFWKEHVHGADRETSMACRIKAVGEKRNIVSEYRMITADGRIRWLGDRISVVVQNDKVVALRGMMIDITERKHMDEALTQESKFVSTVLDTAGALSLIFDTEGRVVRCNQAFEKITGYDFEEVQGKRFWETFLVPEQVESVKTTFTRLLAGQFPANYETDWVVKDGRRLRVAWSNTVLLNPEGKIHYVIATGIDITKRREMEEKLRMAVADLAYSNQQLEKSSTELQAANERLKKMDEVKSNFISAASHELKTPLTSLKGYVDTMLHGEAGPISKQQKDFLGCVKESAERLHRLVNELLDISKIESGQVKMEMERTNLANLLSEEAKVFKAQANQKEISLEVRTERGLKEVYCDEDKIRGAVDNLISNAIKYTPRKGKIRVAAKNTDGVIQIAVSDNGIGIKSEDCARIFEPFQRVNTDGTEGEESTGLGLTLVKRIVEAHGGQVWVESQEGEGSIFTMTLPAENTPHGNGREAHLAYSNMRVEN